jgi:phosphoribosylaminoimidazole-succinocarboxamide synthase
MILDTAAVYIKAFETITGRSFKLPPDEPPLARVRRNLAPYFPR